MFAGEVVAAGDAGLVPPGVIERLPDADVETGPVLPHEQVTTKSEITSWTRVRRTLSKRYGQQSRYPGQLLSAANRAA